MKSILLSSLCTLLMASSVAAASETVGVAWASYGDIDGSKPGEVYSELVMGPNVPVHNKLKVYDTALRPHTLDLQADQFVFEGLVPMVADMDGDGMNEVLVTETDKVKGSSLAVYGMRDGKFAKVAQTPFLGKRPQWLNKAGIADFDGDGMNEVMLVEKPHGGNVISLYKLEGSKLTRMAEVQGPTNHVEGTDYIRSAVRQCEDKAVVVMSDHDWKNLNMISFVDGKLIVKVIGKYKNKDSALNSACE